MRKFLIRLWETLSVLWTTVEERQMKKLAIQRVCHTCDRMRWMTPKGKIVGTVFFCSKLCWKVWREWVKYPLTTKPTLTSFYLRKQEVKP